MGYLAKEIKEAERLLAILKEARDLKEDKKQTKAIVGSDLETKVTRILCEIGIPAHIRGYHYTRDSIIIGVENISILNYVTGGLYPTIAKKNGTTASRVERAIRHAIEVAWNRGKVDVLNSYFGYTIDNSKDKPTNSQFIATIVDKIKLENK